MPVAAVMAASTVASVSSRDHPASVQACTTAVAMDDRKISPTSCTCPARGAQARAQDTSVIARGAGGPAVLAACHQEAYNNADSGAEGSNAQLD